LLVLSCLWVFFLLNFIVAIDDSKIYYQIKTGKNNKKP